MTSHGVFLQKIINTFSYGRMMEHIVLIPHPHKLVCPVCGLVRYLPNGWQVMLKSETLTCVQDQVVMVEEKSAQVEEKTNGNSSEAEDGPDTTIR